jgi:hypothetical protein
VVSLRVCRIVDGLALFGLAEPYLMQKPQSSAELRRSLHHAIECAQRALDSETAQSLPGIHRAFAALQSAVEAVESARLEWFEISSSDEGELRSLVHRIQALVTELLSKVESWQQPAAAARQRAGSSPARWLN